MVSSQHRLRHGVHLLRRFLIASAVAAVAIIVMAAWRLHVLKRRFVLRGAELQAESVSLALFHGVMQEHLRESVVLDGTIDIPAEELEKFDRTLRVFVEPFAIAKVKLFDVSSRIIHSTEGEAVGQVEDANTHLAEALSGSIESHFTRAELGWDSEKENWVPQDLVEAYVPVEAPDGSVIGCFEIYLDVSRELSRGKALAWRLTWMLASLIVLAFGFLASIMFRASRLVRTASDDLIRTERRYRHLFEADGIAVLVLDAGTGHLEDLNATAARLYGWSREEALGRTVGNLVAEGADISGTLERIMAGGSIGVFTSRHRRRDGTEFPVEVSGGTVTTDQDPKAFLVVNDITDRLAAEEEREQIQRRLVQAEKHESLNRMAGSVAHRFNNTLTAVLGSLELALEDVSVGHAVWEDLDAARRSALRAADLGGLMLIYVGQGSIRKQMIDLNGIIVGIEDAPGAGFRRPVAVTVQKEDKPVPVFGDPAQLRRLVTCVVANAVEAVGDGPGHVRVEVGRGHFDCGQFSEPFAGDELSTGEYVYVRVVDDGCGMDPAMTGRVFDPFFTTKEVGRGMGLSTGLGIVKAHKGGVIIDSEPGNGTRVTLCLPPGDPLGDTESPMPAIAADVDSRETAPPLTVGETEDTGFVLLVDDEATVRNIGQRMLERLGLRCVTACGGPEALETMRAGPGQVQLVIADLKMPGMDGRALIREIRALSETTPIVLTSGFAEEDVVVVDDDCRPDAFLHKPFDVSVLKETLRSAGIAGL